MNVRNLMALAALGCSGAGAVLLGQQVWVRGKGWVGERLIERAWSAHLADGQAHRPWSWADIHPIARLDAPRIGVSRIVLEGAAGESLAFGLGHISGTSAPTAPGNCALAGHRDSWATFLRDLRPGDEVRLTTRAGVRVYRVSQIAIVRGEQTEVLAPGPGSRLTLITCFPFSGLLHSPWRFVVTCQSAGEPPASSSSGGIVLAAGPPGPGGVSWR